MSALRHDPLTLAEAARMISEAVKDKSFLELPMGREVKRYLAAKRKELTASSYIGYEGCLHKLATHFAYLELKDFELPIGGERVEEWMDDRWGTSSPGTYNVNHSILRDFFGWQIKHGRMNSNPMELVGRAKKRQIYRSTYSEDQCRAILASADNLRDRIALRLLLYHGLRKGAMQTIQFKHFDYPRHQLTVFTKGGKVKTIPLPEPAFWTDLERHVLEVAAQPDHYLMCVVKPIPYGRPDGAGHRKTRLHRFPDRPMSSTALHRYWYRHMENAGIVAKDTTSGAKMHSARHTAGQRILDATGDIKLVQKFLGHESIQTTADIYVDYDIAQIAARIADVLRGDDE